MQSFCVKVTAVSQLCLPRYSFWHIENDQWRVCGNVKPCMIDRKIKVWWVVIVLSNGNKEKYNTHLPYVKCDMRMTLTLDLFCLAKPTASKYVYVPVYLRCWSWVTSSMQTVWSNVTVSLYLLNLSKVDEMTLTPVCRFKCLWKMQFMQFIGL